MATFTVSTLLGYYVEIAEYSEGCDFFEITIYRPCEKKGQGVFLDMEIPAQISGRMIIISVHLRTLMRGNNLESHPGIRLTCAGRHRQKALDRAYAMIHAWESYLLKKNQEY